VTGNPFASDGAHGPVAALGSQSVLLVGSYCLISFLRGQLINHDTQPAPAENQSNPIAPGVVRQNKRRTVTILSVPVRQSTLELSEKTADPPSRHQIPPAAEDAKTRRSLDHGIPSTA